ncbi:uncharacterized protein LOC144148872 isoform X2 [Haemaphysalis longicornis]
MNPTDASAHPSMRGWELREACTVLAFFVLLTVGLLAIPLCIYWDTRYAFVTLAALVALCLLARTVHERQRDAVLWTSLTISLPVGPPTEEEEHLLRRDRRRDHNSV